MIVALVRDPLIREAVVQAAHPDEDVVMRAADVHAAMHYGFPRLLVHEGDRLDGFRRLVNERGVEVLGLTAGDRTTWDDEHRRGGTPSSAEQFTADRVHRLIRAVSARGWATDALRDLARAAGAPLPASFRGLGRRVMEFPTYYEDLHALERITGLSRGALKARFRRKGIMSPASYLRWFRAMAAAHVLRQPDTTTLKAAHRLGFTSDGNFCRSITATTGLTPTEIRSREGWHHLLIVFSSLHLQHEALMGWSELGGMFVRTRAA
jgi:AraC-like DNA-binding protein